IETAGNVELRLTAVALRRSASRARELAIQTDTTLIVRGHERDDDVSESQGPDTVDGAATDNARTQQ
ncbi:MAG: hypothetical protein WCZ02_09780, partial [Lysobacterales bacterium]